jgi:hypothetical protein
MLHTFHFSIALLLFYCKYYKIKKKPGMKEGGIKLVKKRKYFTDYIDINFFKSNISGFESKYSFNGDSEKYYVSFYKNYKPFIKIEYDMTKPPHYYWLSFFDYNKYPEDIPFKSKFDSFYSDCFEKLISIKGDDSEIESLIKNYKDYVSFHPYFLSYFEFFYEIIHSKLITSINCDTPTILCNVKSNIESIKNTYDRMKEFIYWSLIFYNETGKKISPKLSVRMLEFYLNETGRENIFIKYLFKNTTGFLQSDLCSNQADFMSSCIDDCYNLDNICNLYIDGDVSYDHEFAENLNNLINNDSILSKCPNCGRYFIKRYTSSTTYCTNIFKNTKTNCQEYSSRVKYQNKLYSNPIQAEYYLVRKRKSIKVKRGSLSESEAKLDELCGLRNKYLHLYNNCLDPDKDIIVSAFKEEIKALYN